MHYLDEAPAGAGSGRTVLCLHGQPTWCYLYRKMIPVFLAAGYRVVAPDFFGFGRSDKPVDDAVYTFSFHRGMLMRFIEALDLQRVTLVVQDWGGLLGLTLPMEYPDRIDRLIVMNTGLGVGRSPGPGFDAWKAFVAAKPDFEIGALMQRSVTGLSAAEAAAYDAPFPDRRYRAGVRRFPALVPVCLRWRARRFAAGGTVLPRALERARVHGDRNAGSRARSRGDARAREDDPGLPAAARAAGGGALRAGTGAGSGGGGRRGVPRGPSPARAKVAKDSVRRDGMIGSDCGRGRRRAARRNDR